MIKKEDISIVLPISNIRGWTDICLKSLPKDIEKTIIFNGTHNSYKNKLINDYSIKDYLEFEKNIGLPKAFNNGVKKTNKDWILLIHNDTIMPDNFINVLLDSANQILEIDETVIGFIPITNYSNELNLIYDNEHYANYIQYKPSNKSLVLEEQVEEVMTAYYDNENEGLDALNLFASNIEKNGLQFSYLPEISHFCLLINKKAFDIAGYFDEDFFPICFFEKLFFEDLMIEGYSFVSLKNCYVHHNGNTSSDFFGMNLSNTIKYNKKIFDDKIEERDKRNIVNSDSNNIKAAFVILGNLNNNKEIVKEFYDAFENLCDEDNQYTIDVFCTTESKDLFTDEFSNLNINKFIEMDNYLNDQEDIERAIQLIETLRKNGYDIIKDFTYKVYHGS